MNTNRKMYINIRIYFFIQTPVSYLRVKVWKPMHLNVKDKATVFPTIYIMDIFNATSKTWKMNSKLCKLKGIHNYSSSRLYVCYPQNTSRINQLNI